MDPAVTAQRALALLWASAGLPAEAPAQAALRCDEPALPSSFAVATALTAAAGAAGLAAAEVGRRRGGPRQQLRVDAADALREASARFRLDGREPDAWDPLSGLYRCGDGGWVRLHANFAHHRDGALRLLGLPVGAQTSRAAVTAALSGWTAQGFEQAADDAGLVVAAARGFDAWDAHPHAAAVAAAALPALQRCGDGPAVPWGEPWTAGDRPLRGLRVLDLTRILAGPVAGRTLAAHGAEVLLVNSPTLPNIVHIADTSRGKRSAHLDLHTPGGRAVLRDLVRGSDVWLQGYRPGALAALGFGDDDLQRLRPGLVCVSLSAYGETGPFGGRRGFDSLVQTATGFNLAEAKAFGSAEPRALPLQVLDYSAGFLAAFGALAALLRRAEEGGGWHVQVSLARTGLWLRSLGRCSGFRAVPPPRWDEDLEASDSGFGRLEAARHAVRLSHTPPRWDLPAMPPGTHAPAWCDRLTPTRAAG